MTEQPATLSAPPGTAIYQRAEDGTMSVIGTAAGKIEFATAAVQGYTDSLDELARGCAAAQIQLSASNVSLRRLARAMERYGRRCDVFRDHRRLTLRRQAIAKARGRNWRSVR